MKNSNLSSKTESLFQRKGKGSTSAQQSNFIHDFSEIQPIEARKQAFKTDLTGTRILNKGLTDATLHTEDSHINHIKVREGGFHADYSAAQNEAKFATSTLISRLEEAKNTAQNQLNNLDIERTAASVFEHELAEELKNGEKQIKQDNEVQFQYTENKLQAKQQAFNQCKARQSLHDETDGLPPVEHWYNTPWKYHLCAFLLMVCELPISYWACQNISLPNFTAMILALGISAILVLAAGTAGEAIYRKIHWQLFLSLFVAVLIFAIIIVMRGEEMVIALFNVAVYGIMMGISYQRSTHLDFFLNEEKMASLEASINNLQKQQNTIRKETSKVLADFRATLRAKAEQMANAERKRLEQCIEVKTQQIAALEAYRNEAIQFFNDCYIKTLNKYRSAFIKQRQQLNLAPVTYFEEHPINPLNAAPKNGFSTNGASKSKRNRHFNRVPSLLLLCALFGLLSCEYKSDAPLPDVAFVSDDQTSSSFNMSDSDKERLIHLVTDKIFQLNGAANRKSATVHISTIGETSIQHIETISLAEGKPYLIETKKEREAEIMAFKGALFEQFNQFNHAPRDQQYSHIHRNLCHSLPYLTEVSAARKVMILFSDLIQNSPQVSFYQYKNQPSKIMDNYETLSTTLSSDCEVGDLTGVEIIVVHTPVRANDELVVNAQRFFQKYLLEKGAKISFVANL